MPTGALTLGAAGPSRLAPLDKSGVCPARSSAALLAESAQLKRGQGHCMGRVIIGMDPHKRSATIEIIDDREDRAGRWPVRYGP